MKPRGFIRLHAGANENIIVKVSSKLVTPTLYAMLHEDFGTIGKLEFPGPDIPVMVNGQMISPVFKILAPGSASGDVVIDLHQSADHGPYLVNGDGTSYSRLPARAQSSDC